MSAHDFFHGFSENVASTRSKNGGRCHKFSTIRRRVVVFVQKKTTRIFALKSCSHIIFFLMSLGPERFQ